MNKILTHLFHSQGEIKELNLSDEEVKTFNVNDPNPLLDADFCLAWIRYLHKLHKTNYSYGDYLADRSCMLAGSYLEEEHKWIHLGVDISPSNCYTTVYSPLDAEIIDVFEDKDQNGGWGGRITLQTKNGIVVFAHLNLGFLAPKVGDQIPAGKCIGFIENNEKNGGWWPHLHLQGLRDISLLKDLDGYAEYRDDLEKDYPNPLKILELI